MVSGGLIPMEVFEDDLGFVRLLEGLRALGRVVVFDRRGLGVSDPIVDWERPVLEQWADDLSAVVDASGVQDPTIFAWDGYGIATRFAARHPDRLRWLVLLHPSMIPDDRWDHWAANRRAMIRQNVEGTAGDFLAQIAPSRASDASFRDWYARAGRAGASPDDRDSDMGIGVQLTTEGAAPRPRPFRDIGAVPTRQRLHTPRIDSARGGADPQRDRR